MNTMATIEQGKTLRYEKVASFRSKLAASEINDAVQKFVKTLQESGAQKVGPMISATHGLEEMNGQQVFDIEFLVALDRKVNLNVPYSYKEVFQLGNALYTRYVGDPTEIQQVYNNLIEYINSHNLQQITTLYNVNIDEQTVSSNSFSTVDIYISINPNIL